MDTYNVFHNGEFLGTISANTREDAIDLAELEFGVPAYEIRVAWVDPEF